MKNLKKISSTSEIVEQDYTVIYYNETVKTTAVKALTEPQITITVGNSTDTAVLALTCIKNATVKGEITWSCNLPSNTATIEGSNLTFIKHYDGNVTLTATATNCSATKTINVSCDETITATTYTLGTLSPIADVDATSTSARFCVNFGGDL